MVDKSLKIGGEIPAIKLFRFYSNKNYADQFANGNFRFGWQKYYSDMEGDIREDSTEGTASFTIDGNSPGAVIESGSIGGWESYILCTSEVDNEIKLKALSERFSKPEDTSGYVVEISDLDRFTRDVANALKASPFWNAIDCIYWKKVEYTKHDHLGSGPPDVDLHSYQKPPHISSFEFQNKSNGKKVTLSSTHMFLAGSRNIASIYYPEKEWTKTETRHDYTIESEWRLIVSIKMRFKVEQLNIPMFVTGLDRNQRICSRLKIDDLQLQNYSSSEIDRLLPPNNFWIDTIAVNSGAGHRSYLTVEKITFIN